MQRTFQVMQSAWTSQSSLPSNPTARMAWNCTGNGLAWPRGAAQASSPSRGHIALADLPHEVRGAPVPTLDTAGLVTVVRTVAHLVTLLCSMDTGPITTLKFIWLAGHQSFKKTHSSISHIELSLLCNTYQLCPSDTAGVASSVSKCQSIGCFPQSNRGSSCLSHCSPVPLCCPRSSSTSLGKQQQSPYEDTQSKQTQCWQWSFSGDTEQSKQAAKLPAMGSSGGCSLWEAKLLSGWEYTVTLGRQRQLLLSYPSFRKNYISDTFRNMFGLRPRQETCSDSAKAVWSQ